MKPHHTGTATVGLATVFAVSAPVVGSAFMLPLEAVGSTRVKEGSAIETGFVAEADHLQYELWPEASRRLVMLGLLDEDHDGEGASRPHPSSLETALLFVRQLPYYAPEPLVGVDHDGFAVVEFRDDGDLGQVVFKADGTGEIFYSSPGRAPFGYEGAITDDDFRRAFLQAFGFRFTA